MITAMTSATAPAPARKSAPVATPAPMTRASAIASRVTTTPVMRMSTM